MTCRVALVNVLEAIRNNGILHSDRCDCDLCHAITEGHTAIQVAEEIEQGQQRLPASADPLRDTFAAAALAGLMTSEAFGVHAHEETAVRAWRFADLMLEVREKQME